MEPWLARAARIRGERAALTVAGAGARTYAELYGAARAVAGALHERGVGPGDRVALALPGSELVPALHGCLLLGAIAVPIDLHLSAAERAERTATATLAIDAPLAGPPVVAVHHPEPAEIATLMFTSGTTAHPKPVALSYDNWRWNAIGSALALGLDDDERWLCPMPLAHVGGLSIQLRSTIYGTGVVLHERFDTEAVLAALQDSGERITLVSLVPTMLARLLDAGLRAPPTLRRVLLGGGPIAPGLLERARAAEVAVSPSFGMTETCSQIATDGWPLFGAELAIAEAPPAPAATGSDAADGERVVGELLVRGPAVSVGALAQDGWLHTGDLGALDERGRLTIVGRRADTIVTGGENVAPAEVEAALEAHPAVADAAVFGRADPEWGEAVVALVVLRDGVASVAAEQLRVYCAERLAPFKVPKRFEFVDAVPRGPTGKLLRRELR